MSFLQKWIDPKTDNSLTNVPVTHYRQKSGPPTTPTNCTYQSRCVFLSLAALELELERTGILYEVGR